MAEDQEFKFTGFRMFRKIIEEDSNTFRLLSALEWAANVATTVSLTIFPGTVKAVLLNCRLQTAEPAEPIFFPPKKNEEEVIF